MKDSKRYGIGIAGAAFAMVLAACSSSTQSLSYDYNENNCDTGNHEFSSQSDKCAGLEDYKLNNGCAYDLRKSDFQTSGCSGTFTESDNS